MRYAQRLYKMSAQDNTDFPEWYMQPGMRVIFDNPNSGWPKGFKRGLVPDETYTLKEVWVGMTSTDVELEEVEGKFNSVYFSVIGGQIEDDITRVMFDSASLARGDVNVVEPKEVTFEAIEELADELGYRGVYFECNSGWDHIVKPLVDFVLDNGGIVDQVKEKFGGLRFYYTQPLDEWSDEKWRAFAREVGKAEDLSYMTCEFTGKPGRMRAKSKGGWLKTLCDEKAEEFGYDKTVDTPF